jgi:hypothetical protein
LRGKAIKVAGVNTIGFFFDGWFSFNNACKQVIFEAGIPTVL